MRSKWMAAAVSLAVVATALAGCSASDSGGSDEKVTLNYWAWGAFAKGAVDEFNKTHPNIQVNYTDAGGGTTSAGKLLAASRAGNAPDVSLVEYVNLPSMVINGVALDITNNASDIKTDFPEGSWAQMTLDDKVYGIPQADGPSAYVYRKDVFDQYGIAAPKTWDDFKTAAQTIKEKDPNAVIASISAKEFGFWAGVTSQNGGNFWSYKDGKWTVGFDDPKTLEVADFFGGMAKEGLVSTEELLTPAYNKELNDGTMLSWPSAIWAPSVIEGVAADTSGKWALSPLPVWNDSDTSVPYQGGSGVIVTKNSKHPEQAYEFAKWLNASEEGSKLLVDQQQYFPASVVGQDYAKTQEPPKLMPQQTDYWDVAEKIAQNTQPSTWGPNVSLASTTLQDELNKAITNGTPWSDAFKATQKVIVDDMKKAGYEVTN